MRLRQETRVVWLCEDCGHLHRFFPDINDPCCPSTLEERP